LTCPIEERVRYEELRNRDRIEGRSLLRDVDLTKEEFIGLLDLSEHLRHEKRSATEKKLLKGKNIALIFEKSSTRTRSAFEVPRMIRGRTSLHGSR